VASLTGRQVELDISPTRLWRVRGVFKIDLHSPIFVAPFNTGESVERLHLRSKVQLFRYHSHGKSSSPTNDVCLEKAERKFGAGTSICES